MEEDYVPEKYSDYRNRYFKKTTDKIENIISGIRQCSLKGEDKEKLKKKIIEMVQDKLSK